MDVAAKALPPGTLVTMRRADDTPLGVAMFNPHSLVAARLLDRDAGRAIGRRFFARRLERALRQRPERPRVQERQAAENAQLCSNRLEVQSGTSTPAPCSRARS